MRGRRNTLKCLTRPCPLNILTHTRTKPTQKHTQKHRLNRNAEKGGDNKASLDKNFEKVGRGRSTDGSDQFKSPDIATQKKHWKHLVQYFESYEEVSAELDAKLKKIVDINNDIIVMVANAGVIELLANFVCSARSRNLDISNIIGE